MILDKCQNALCYLGISPQMDAALRFIAAMEPERLEAGSRVELMGDAAYYTVGEPVFCPKPMRFEHHRRYIDIHVPVTRAEQIALCPAIEPDDGFDEEKDVGFFAGEPVNTVVVPAGWFCVCFAQDAHVPCIGEDERAALKVVVKVRA